MKVYKNNPLSTEVENVGGVITAKQTLSYNLEFDRGEDYSFILAHVKNITSRGIGVSTKSLPSTKIILDGSTLVVSGSVDVFTLDTSDPAKFDLLNAIVLKILSRIP